MMRRTAEFVSAHMADDVTRLILDRSKWPEIDMDMAVSCIESRRKLKGKVQEWYDHPRLVFPIRLSAEQCSSSATGRYKAKLAERIAGKHPWRIADLTGGLGVDSWFFSQKAEAVLYNEMQKPLCDAASYNFGILEADNIRISNRAVGQEGIPGQTSPDKLLSGFDPDIVYMDPARRGEGGRKVFLIEECTPDVLALKDGIFQICRHMLIKLSPMADISMVCARLGSCCREVHVVASEGECKELLIWMDRDWEGEQEIVAVELHKDGSGQEFRFHPREEAEAKKTPAAACTEGIYLFEPGKALMKAGAFSIIAERFHLDKLGQSTHYYITDSHDSAEALMDYGRVYRIMQVQPLNKRSMKEAGKAYPKAEVTARNIPMDTDALRKKLGVSSGDDIHIFGLRSDRSGNLLFVTSRHTGI